MYGLEKNKEFLFDMQKDLHEDPKKAKEMLEKVQSKIKEIKDFLKSESTSKETEELATILEGYISIEQVIKKVKKS